MMRAKCALVFGLMACVGFGVSTLHAASIIDEWANVKAPPLPELKAVTVDPEDHRAVDARLLQAALQCGT